jgi:hypothetical protein
MMPEVMLEGKLEVMLDPKIAALNSAISCERPCHGL